MCFSQYIQHNILRDAGPRKPRGSDVVDEKLSSDTQVIETVFSTTLDAERQDNGCTLTKMQREGHLPHHVAHVIKCQVYVNYP